MNLCKQALDSIPADGLLSFFFSRYNSILWLTISPIKCFVSWAGKQSDPISCLQQQRLTFPVQGEKRLNFQTRTISAEEYTMNEVAYRRALKKTLSLSFRPRIHPCPWRNIHHAREAASTPDGLSLQDIAVYSISFHYERLETSCKTPALHRRQWPSNQPRHNTKKGNLKEGESALSITFIPPLFQWHTQKEENNYETQCE